MKVLESFGVVFFSSLIIILNQKYHKMHLKYALTNHQNLDMWYETSFDFYK